jgi:Family of unknown function (DUF6734)
MKIVQSFWTKPFLLSANALSGSRLNGGWPDKKYNYFSWALSCLQLSRYYKDIELITDDLGKYILIEKIKLPYRSVRSELNKLDKYDTSFWALGKLYAYSIQQEPFVHVDNDIFISAAFDSKIARAELVAQNREVNIREFAITLNSLFGKINNMPICLKRLKGAKEISCSSAGILGGTNVAFFQKYTAEAFNFVNNNMRVINRDLPHLHQGNLNIIYEQVMFFEMARMQAKPVTYLFPFSEQQPHHIGYFHASRVNAGFVHAGGYYKMQPLVYRLLEWKLKTMYPEYYDRIINLVNTSEI